MPKISTKHLSSRINEIPPSNSSPSTFPKWMKTITSPKQIYPRKLQSSKELSTNPSIKGKLQSPKKSYPKETKFKSPPCTIKKITIKTQAFKQSNFPRIIVSKTFQIVPSKKILNLHLRKVVSQKLCMEILSFPTVLPSQQQVQPCTKTNSVKSTPNCCLLMESNLSRGRSIAEIQKKNIFNRKIKGTSIILFNTRTTQS